jgi:DNA-binding XRE family transcriptional regulator
VSQTVTIPQEEYDRLVGAAEDLADIRAYDAAMTEASESIPSEYVKRLIDGESPVRVYRDLRGLTQMALSELAHVNRVQIADIEAKRKTGSVETLHKLATALDVLVDDLI